MRGSHGHWKGSLLLERSERWGGTLGSRLILLPRGCLSGWLCQALQLQLSCQIHRPPKCFSFPQVSDGPGTTICHLKCQFWSSKEAMSVLYETFQLFWERKLNRWNLEQIPLFQKWSSLSENWLYFFFFFTIQFKNPNKQLADLCFSKNRPGTFTNWKNKHP